MMDNNHLNELRRRAELLLASRKKISAPESDVYQLVEELNLYQAELEVQNEDLIKTQIDLQLSHNKYADLYNLAPVAYFTLDTNGLIADVNQAGLDLLGMKRRMLINRCFSRYVIPESQELFSQYRQSIMKDGISRNCELKLMRWSGPSFEAQLESRAIRNINSDAIQVLMCITDISKRIETEKFIHLQKVRMSAIDRIRSMNEQIYSISRNQNHSLAVIDNYLYGCIRRLESGHYTNEDLLKVLRNASQQTRVLAEIIQRMKNFCSRIVMRYEISNMNLIIREALDLIKYEIMDFPVKVHYEASDHAPSVRLDKLHVQHVILNLTRNAIEAMRDAAVNDPKLFLETRITENNLVEISVIDNGPGFDPDAGSQLFEPHFTTKPYAMGLGLSISRTIVEKHSGHIQALLNPSGGAHFQLTLPCLSMTT